MQQRRFMQLDVFSDAAYRGNPLAVVLDGAGLSDDAMQGFARWANLSEATFLLPPTAPARAAGADYRVRIFTPVGELAFAGHPTLGSCHAWLAAGGQPQRADVVVQECAKGLITIERQAQGLAFAAPPLIRSNVDTATQTQMLAALQLGADDLIAAQWLDNGSRWMGLLMRDPACLQRAQPQAHALRQLGAKAGLCAVHSGAPAGAATLGDRGTHQSTGAPVLEVRAITLTAHGIAEDPATGGLNASLAQWLTAEHRVALPYSVQQGAAVGRAGRLRVYGEAAGTIWVQGQVHACITGQVLL